MVRGMRSFRIVVCQKCGALYDVHYIDDVEMIGESIVKFRCANCGMVPYAGKAGLSKANENFKI